MDDCSAAWGNKNQIRECYVCIREVHLNTEMYQVLDTCIITHQSNAAGLFQRLVCHTPHTWWGLNRSQSRTDVRSAASLWLPALSPSPWKTKTETWV